MEFIVARKLTRDEEKTVFRTICLLIDPKVEKQNLTLDLGANFGAVFRILKHANVSTRLVGAVVIKYLAMHKRAGYFRSDVLSNAANLLQLGVSRRVAQKVVTELARNGFLGRIENTAGRYLGRGLLPEEVHALIEAYCNNTACQSNCEEDKLAEMADKYLVPAEAEVAKNKLLQFREEFHSGLD